MQIIKPPTLLDWRNIERPAIFLAGSIEQGAADDWQTEISESIKKDIEYGAILNPRRDDWDTSWKQELYSNIFRSQVEWELEAMERCDFIIIYFAPGTKSPISLMELGLFAKDSHKLIVCCPNGFWRKGNVDVVCRRYQIRQVPTLDELKKDILNNLERTGHHFKQPV